MQIVIIYLRLLCFVLPLFADQRPYYCDWKCDQPTAFKYSHLYGLSRNIVTTPIIDVDGCLMFNFTCALRSNFVISLANASHVVNVFNISSATVYCGSPPPYQYKFHLKSMDDTVNISKCGEVGEPTCSSLHANNTFYNYDIMWPFDRFGCLGLYLCI